MSVEDHGALGFETRQVHAGSIIDAQTKARVTPIYQSAGYVFDDFDDGEARFAGRSEYRAYSRNDNPTNIVAGRRLAELEGGVDATLVASGQAAIAVTLFALARAGDHVLTTASLYEGTREMFRGSLARQGLEFTPVPAAASEDEWLALVRPTTKAIYTESIPNPLGDVVDIPLLGRVAARSGIPLIVDNTVATPYLFRPFEWGAHLVIHSTSKWLSGHGSVIGGAIVDSGLFDWAASGRFPQLTEPTPGRPRSFTETAGRGAFLSYLRSVSVLEYGPALSPFSSFLLLHGIETLSLRMERHVSNAARIAEELAAHPAVRAVHYPGLRGSPFFERAQELLPQGAGSVVSMDLGSRAAARVFLDGLAIISQMTHIGDVRTLAIHTGSTIHGKLDESERLDLGITPGLVRLSIGIESIDDLLVDLRRALSPLTASVGIG